MTKSFFVTKRKNIYAVKNIHSYLVESLHFCFEVHDGTRVFGVASHAEARAVVRSAALSCINLKSHIKSISYLKVYKIGNVWGLGEGD